MISRRTMLMALPGVSWAGFSPAKAAGRRIAVAFPSQLEPCTEALEGLRQQLAGPVECDALDVTRPDFAVSFGRAMALNPAAVVAVGTDAARAVLHFDSPIRTISTMTLEADRIAGNPARKFSAGVYLDIPIRMQAAEVRKVFPQKGRLGVIRNPARTGDAAGTRDESHDGVIYADCATADELLPTFLAFRKRVDFVVCLPDGSLYNSATARPLILASLENRLPIVGFSPAFLRAGAAAAIYPDYRNVGQQTGELVHRCLESGCGGWETPRKVNIAVNSKVLRMLGISCQADANPGLAVMR